MKQLKKVLIFDFARDIMKKLNVISSQNYAVKVCDFINYAKKRFKTDICKAI